MRRLELCRDHIGVADRNDGESVWMNVVLGGLPYSFDGHRLYLPAVQSQLVVRKVVNEQTPSAATTAPGVSKRSGKTPTR